MILFDVPEEFVVPEYDMVRPIYFKTFTNFQKRCSYLVKYEMFPLNKTRTNHYYPLLDLCVSDHPKVRKLVYSVKRFCEIKNLPCDWRNIQEFNLLVMTMFPRYYDHLYKTGIISKERVEFTYPTF